MPKRKPTSRPKERPPAATPPRAPKPRRPARRPRVPGGAMSGAGGALVEAVRTLRRSWFVILALGIVGFGVYSGVHAVRSQQQKDFSGQTSTPSERPTQTATTAQPAPKLKPLPVADVFAQQCGVCHTLSAAKSRGGIGPNLDTAQGLTAGRVRAQIANGSPDGAMPPGILTGADADRVSRFVAREAGRRAKG
ncbi:MAG: cytochrome [Solirubrobacteraceae bacterium]|jgi:mono/diheme cytochrome c family protein|nr:cytochrome [Solirubrobacteraceae bacterium]